MSYLDSLRLSFAGRFFTDPSTVNNHPNHYQNAAFDRSKHWLPGGGDSDEHGWWNPQGANRFRFVDVVVTGASYDDGSAASGDPIVGMRLVSRERPDASMADLDPEQQLMSMIFGLKLTLVDSSGRRMVSGDFAPAPFFDIWGKAAPGGGGGDITAAAAWQSVLEVDAWGDVSASRFLQQLRSAAADDTLSIKFNVDAYNMDAGSERFAHGRIAGAIGVARRSDPRHFVIGRHFGNETHPVGTASPGFVPQSGVNYFVGVHDATRRKLRLDLGNALPTRGPGEPNKDLGPLSVGWRSGGAFVEIGVIDYLGEDWLEQTGGIVEIPAGRELNDAETHAIGDNPLCLVAQRPAGKVLLSEEPPAHVRADLFVARLDPGDHAELRFVATKLGRPFPAHKLEIGVLVPADEEAAANYPLHGLQVPDSVMTDAAGEARVVLSAADPRNPRFFSWGEPRVHVDGQVYWLVYQLKGISQCNPSNYLGALVWNTFVADTPPTWHGSIAELFIRYANLYPYMTTGVSIDLADYEQVAAAAPVLVEVLALPREDARHMPATRDLSRSRRDAMITWLNNPGVDGKPLLGLKPLVLHALMAEAVDTRGSKTLAAERAFHVWTRRQR